MVKSNTTTGKWHANLRALRRFRDEEDGGLILFALYIFLVMLLIAGIAVDMMRFETRRTALQNTLDAASLAATNLKRESDPTELVKDFMSKRGYDASLVSVTPEETRVGQDLAAGDEGTLIARRVTAGYDLRVNTFFMHMLGIEELGTASAGAAFERVQNVEISLVVDISGSMGGQKIKDLKSSAINFFQSVVDEERTEGITSVSVIPYNHTIVVPDLLLDRLNTTDSGFVPEDDRPRPSPGADPYPGALANYSKYNAKSKCIRFFDSDMTTNDLEADYLALRAITPEQQLTRMAYYDPGGSTGSKNNYNRPKDNGARRCDPTRSPILPFATSLSDLETHINGLRTGGWTAIENGIKWGVALLDPALRPMVTQMIADEILPAKMKDRPGDYEAQDELLQDDGSLANAEGTPSAMKVLVLMTDGANTNQYDIKDGSGSDPNFKYGPSRIWFSESASKEGTDEDPDKWTDVMIVDQDGNGSADREKRWYDGYFIEMPDNSSDERWMRPHKPWISDDGVVYAASDLPDDAVQMDWVELFDRFTENAVAEWFRDDTYGDATMRNWIRNAEKRVETTNSANFRMNGNSSTDGICDAVKHKDHILIFSIAFQAGSTAETQMRNCASGPGYYFDADNGQELNEAFAAIAGAITKLRLTQ